MNENFQETSNNLSIDIDEIEFIDMGIKSRLLLNKNKLQFLLKSLQSSIKMELDSIKAKEEEYRPSNDLGIIHDSGTLIDGLMVSISELYDMRKQINSLLNKKNRENKENKKKEDI